jgi:hypothetical protein
LNIFRAIKAEKISTFETPRKKEQRAILSPLQKVHNHPTLWLERFVSSHPVKSSHPKKNSQFIVHE